MAISWGGRARAAVAALALTLTAAPATAQDGAGGSVPPQVPAATATGATPTADGSALTTTGEAAVTVGRLAGNTRYETAVAISRKQFPGGARTAYIARGDDFADALAGGVLRDGPVLLVPSCGTVPTAVKAEIRRLAPTRVRPLGSDAAVCDATVADAAQGIPTSRVAGLNRYGTASSISRVAFPDGARVAYLARGDNAPDAVAGGALKDGPILLASKDGQSVPAETREAIARVAPDRVVALGGSAAVSDAALQTAAGSRTRSRLAGADRYATSVSIATRAFPSGSSRVYLARGDGQNFADAVAGGVLTDGPVLLVKGPCGSLPSSVRAYLQKSRPTAITLLGGADVVCDAIGEEARRAATPTTDCSVARCVSLTFDDGPGAYTDGLLDTLDRYDAPATFFAVGQQVVARPAVARRIVAEGHSLQNHTWDHKQMTTLTRDQQYWEYDYTADRLQALGLPRTTLLRPPYGSWNASTRTLGVPLILWSVDPEDWKYRDSAVVRANVKAGVHNGAIILLHDVHPTTVNAVPGIISDLRSAGYTIVPLTRLVPGMEPGDIVYRRGQVNEYSSGAASVAPQVRDEFDPFPVWEAQQGR